MTGLSQTAFAQLAGISQQAISKACRTGHLVRTADGRIDPDQPVNAEWLALHRDGYDARVRRLDSYWPGPRRPEPEGSSLFEDWGGLVIDAERADRLLDRVRAAGGDPIAFLVASLERLRSEVACQIAAQQRRIEELEKSSGARAADGGLR